MGYHLSFRDIVGAITDVVAQGEAAGRYRTPRAARGTTGSGAGRPMRHRAVVEEDLCNGYLARVTERRLYGCEKGTGD